MSPVLTSPPPVALLLRRLRAAVPVLIFGAGVVLTLLVWQVSQQQWQDKARVAFEFELGKFAHQLESHFQTTGQVLRGLAGLFAASNEVDRSEFRRYVSVLQLDERYPGIQGLGYAQVLTPERLRRPAREQGLAGNTEPPPGERSLHSAVVYLEPLDWRNQRTIGFDMMSDAVRRKAMERARDTALVALSGQVSLPQESVLNAQIGVYLYAPVFRGGEGGESLAQRRSNLLGWVYAPLRVKDLLQGVIGTDFANLSQRWVLELYDSAQVEPTALMFRTGPRPPAGGAVFEQTQTLMLAGQPWTLRAYALPSGINSANALRGRGILIAGTLLSALLALLAGVLLHSHARSVAALAESALAHRLLSQSQAEVQAMFDTSGVGMLLVDTQGIVTRANQRMAEMFGFSREALFGMPYELLVPADERELVRQRIHSLVGSGAAELNIERRYLRVNGTEFWGFLSARRLLDAAGATLGLVGVVVDLSERREAEQRLLRSERLYRTLAESMQDVVWTLDMENLRFTYCSPSVERVFGYAVSDCVGAGLERIFASETVARLHALLGQRAADFVAGKGAADHAYVDEIDHVCRDGRSVPAEVNSLFLRDEDTGHVVLRGVTRNIEERKRHEEELRIAAVAFESHESTVVTDAAGRIMRVNRAFTELSGYRPDEVLGKSMQIVHSGRHDQAFYELLWAQVLASGFWQGEIWNRRKDGHVFPEWLTITAVKNTTGHTTHYVGSSFDITRQVQHQSEIRNLAFYDPLTGLANRRLFADRLCHAFAKSGRSQKFGAVLYIDLDRFKEVNDTLGHGEGDRLLELVADRIATNVREGDTVARFGGDEFVVLLEDVDDTRELALQTVLAVAEKLRQALSLPYHLHGAKPGDWVCSSSIGVAVFRGSQEDMESVLIRADRAMYCAKDGGRNAVYLGDDAAEIVENSNECL